MSITIHYKRQQKAITPRAFTSDSGNPDEREVNLKDIVREFDIPHKQLKTVAKEYPKAQLEEIDEDAEDKDTLELVDLEWYGIFLCKQSKTYRLFLGQRAEILDNNEPRINKSSINNISNLDIEMAAILSDAVYNEDPIKYINMTYHSCNSLNALVGLKFASNASCPYLIGITKTEANKETMWIAFRGTTNWEDILTNLTIIPSLSDNGMVHRGFWGRSSKFPHRRFANECYQSSNSLRRLIFTGHSLGGSVAHLSALRHLVGKSYNEEPQIFSITFGTPFFCNKTVAEELVKRNLNQHFLTVVNHGDCVPNLLNIVESVKLLESTIKPANELCKAILKTLSPLPDLLSKGTALIKKIVDNINNLLPKLKDILKNMHLEYKPVGTYGFINADSDSEPCEWEIAYLKNELKTVSGEQILDDQISRKLTSLCSASSQKYTVDSIISHFMVKYIEGLKSCRVIESNNNNMREMIELIQFDVKVESTVAVCRYTDMKITLTGDNLDFISSDKLSCLESDPELFQKDSYTTLSDQTQHGVVLACSTLIQSEKQIKIGRQKFFLHTHFGKIEFNFRWEGQMATYPVQRGMFCKLDKNFLMAAFLRSIFAYVHAGNPLTVREIIEGDPTILQYFMKLIKNRLPEKFGPFVEKLQEYLNEYSRQKSNNEPLILNSSLYDDSKIILQDLHEALTKLPIYDFQKSIKEIISDNPLIFAACSGGAIMGLIVWLEAARIALVCARAVGITDQLIAAYSGAQILQCVGSGACITSAFGIGCLLPGTIERLLYQSHINLLLDSMGGDSTKCANEEMTENEICKILMEKCIHFRLVNMEDRPAINTIIKDKKIFNMETVRDQSVLGRAALESQRCAFQLLHDVYYIHELRKWMTEHIYISFIGAHRAGKSSLLKSLWHLPSQIGHNFRDRTKQLHLYTLEDAKKNNKVHIIDFPGVTDPDKEISLLTDDYAICSSFYVIVVQGGTDYAEATKLIHRIQTSTMINGNMIKKAHSPTNSQSDDSGIRSSNTSVPFVVIVTHADWIQASSFETEMEELAKDRLKIEPQLICPCFNKEAIRDKEYVDKYNNDNLPNISQVREFLTKHFSKVFGEHHKFNEYMNYRYERN